jgi:hypothetical protein
LAAAENIWRSLAPRRVPRQARRSIDDERNFVAIKWNFENHVSELDDLTKNRIAVVPFGPSLSRRILRNSPDALNLRRGQPDISPGRDFYHFCTGEPDMPKVARIAAKIPASTALPASTASSEKSESNTFVSIALFSGIGLLVSLIAVLLGVSGVWF